MASLAFVHSSTVMIVAQPAVSSQVPLLKLPQSFKKLPLLRDLNWVVEAHKEFDPQQSWATWVVN